jgi:mannose-6-phosphate isomerase-like protein (cupin superfamily)
MADYTAKKISEMETGFGGGMVKVRAEMGVSSFGAQVIQLPPNFGDYPEHDHSEDGQEELYTALEGSGTIDIEGDSVALDKDTLVRVASDTKRKVSAGPAGLKMLVIGGCPGEPYKVSPFSELGA